MFDLDRFKADRSAFVRRQSSPTHGRSDHFSLAA
jgi:hypothetical protein